jgi:hypothetical protein
MMTKTFKCLENEDLTDNFINYYQLEKVNKLIYKKINREHACTKLILEIT